MTLLRRSTAQRRVLAALTVAATVASGSALLGPGLSSASSHREAPYVAGDPAIDNTDVYAFTSPDKASTATLIANWSPFQDPSGGPNFYPWATDAAYDINIDNNGDAKADITYRWTFKDVDTRGTTNHGDNTAGHLDSAGKPIAPSGVDGTFLYNDGAVTSLTDANLLAKQTYTLTEIDTTTNGAATSKTLLTDIPVAPSNTGDASFPDYSVLRKQAVAAGAIPNGGGTSYVGQADDPFFLDLRVFDLLYGGSGFKESKYDTLSHYNVNTIALQVPKTDLAAPSSTSGTTGDPVKNKVIGIWSSTSRYTTRVLAATGSAPGTAQTSSTGALAQVSRLGNPLVNEVVVPSQLKDYFNRSTPSQDGALLGKVQNPELPYLVEALYKVPNPNKQAAGNGRNDLVATFLTGFSKKVFAGDPAYGNAGKGILNADLNSLDLNEVASTVTQAPAEYLRLNLAVPPTAKPNRLGVLGGDLAGFPNGRRLTDDVIDEALQVTEGVLLPGGQGAGLGDGVNANDTPFLSVFPYIADPHSGSSVNPGQKPLDFHQRFFSTGSGQFAAGVTGITPAQPGGKVLLYRIAGGKTTLLGTMALNAAGTDSKSLMIIKAPPGTTMALLVRINTGPNSPNSTGDGHITGFTVR